MNKADVLAGLRKKPVPVAVGELSLFLKPLTVGQKEAFAMWRKGNPGPVGVVSRLLAASLCDADGNLLLASADEAADLDGALCDALCDRIVDINGMKAPTRGKASSPRGKA